MAELRGQLCGVEVPDPVRALTWVVPVEVLYRGAHCSIARDGVASPGERPRLHDVEVRRQDGDADRVGPEPG